MARADIFLWDDPFSSVDVILERQILEQLSAGKWLEGKTVILTSHRLTTVRACDDFIHISKESNIEEAGPVLAHLTEGTKLYEYFRQQMV
jgi:ATP-binding cassette subfamily B protein